MDPMHTIQGKADALLPQLKAIRQHLHRYPELSFEEKQTSAFIATELEKMGLPIQRDIGGTGITALIAGKSPDKKCIALRADMDALPIQEQNQTPYRSQHDGIMHACGHDVHTACLLGAARILNDLKEHLEGSIKLIFQPGEEKSPGGASLMIKEGVLTDPAPESIFALHVDPALPTGTVGFKTGQYMASADEIHIAIKGKGGHAAQPHLCIDPITIAATVLTTLQQVVSRRSNPLTPTVLSFGKIEGGHTTNVIPDQVVIAGTLRTFNETWRTEAITLIKNITQKTAEAFGAKAEIIIPAGYPSLYNDQQLTQSAIQEASNFLGKENVSSLDLRMTAEDFSFYAQKIKGCFFRLGTNENNERYTAPVHSPFFDIAEKAMATGAGMLSWLAFRECNRL
jgi:hippurate hydrolase